MMKYLKNQKTLTPEEEKTIKRLALSEAKKQKENPKLIFWYEKRFINAKGEK